VPQKDGLKQGGTNQRGEVDRNREYGRDVERGEGRGKGQGQIE
jgi:hypothetical protein